MFLPGLLAPQGALQRQVELGMVIAGYERAIGAILIVLVLAHLLFAPFGRSDDPRILFQHPSCNNLLSI